MRETVPRVPVDSVVETTGRVLPERVQEALGELVGAAQEGLLALSVGVGLGVLAELMEEELDEVVGPKGRHDAARTAVRHGHQPGEVTLGGRRLPVSRPRARTVDGSGELSLATYAHFADRDVLSRVVLERMLAGVSTRRYRRLQEPVGGAVDKTARSTSRSAVSRAFVERTEGALRELLGRRLEDLRLAVLMIDGIDLKGRCNVVALGITTSGVKIPLGLRDGSTENTTVVTALLSDLVERGLDASQGVLCVLDGSKALRRAVRVVFGDRSPVQRCIRHKERNVLEHLPEHARTAVRRRLRAAWQLDDHAAALGRLTVLAGELERSHPGAAASLREGLPETLTITRLGVTGSLKRTLASTNPCESMIECVRRTSRNVKHWSSGQMCLRWTAAGMLEAERQFRKVIGYQQLAQLAVAVERDLAGRPAAPVTEQDGMLVSA
ncbi:MAG: IS256 family transposase [Solirubrobacterales bacterium]|nr:IS256 family transposase [Solirubrobacterales bacterium]